MCCGLKNLQELGAAQRNQPQNYKPLQRLDPPANHASSDLKKMLGRQEKKLELKQSKLRFRRETFVKWVEEAMKHVCADKQAQPTDSKQVLLKSHLEKISAFGLYKSRVDSQTAYVLDL